MCNFGSIGTTPKVWSYYILKYSVHCLNMLSLKIIPYILIFFTSGYTGNVRFADFTFFVSLTVLVVFTFLSQFWFMFKIICWKLDIMLSNSPALIFQFSLLRLTKPWRQNMCIWSTWTIGCFRNGQNQPDFFRLMPFKL